MVRGMLCFFPSWYATIYGAPESSILEEIYDLSLILIFHYVCYFVMFAISFMYDPLVNVYSLLWKITIEIVDLPINNGDFL